MSKKTDFVLDEQATQTPIMENTQNTETTSTALETSTETTEVSLTLPTNVDLAALMAASSNLGNAEVVMNLEAGYLELKNIGDFENVIFMGYGTSKHKSPSGELVEKTCIKVLQNRQMMINSGVSLVRSFQDANLAVGTAVRITYSEDRKVDAGKVKIYSLALLG
jgi:hypothetical protein